MKANKQNLEMFINSYLMYQSEQQLQIQIVNIVLCAGYINKKQDQRSETPSKQTLLLSTL